MSKFQKLYEKLSLSKPSDDILVEDGEEVKALLLQKRNLQDAIRNNPSKYPEEDKIRQQKLKVIDKRIKLAKDKGMIEDEEERIQDQINRLNKKKSTDAKTNTEGM